MEVEEYLVPGQNFIDDEMYGSKEAMENQYSTIDYRPTSWNTKWGSGHDLGPRPPASVTSESASAREEFGTAASSNGCRYCCCKCKARRAAASAAGAAVHRRSSGTHRRRRRATARAPYSGRY